MTRRDRTIELVDARTLLAHELTPNALAAGRAPRGRYVALCGADVLPAAMAEPRAGPLQVVQVEDPCSEIEDSSMTWFVRSAGDHDTHRGTLSRGRVDAACGIRFRPVRRASGRLALRSEHLDPAQVCPECGPR